MKLRTRTLLPLHHEYPRDLRDFKKPRTITIHGDIDDARLRVAIVGARDALPITLEVVRSLATAVVRAGAVVISGGARGVDSEAHVAALDAGGRTWVVLGCGAPKFPSRERNKQEESKRFFLGLAARGATLIWPFDEGADANPGTFPSRNEALVALSQIVIVAQAGVKSGSLNSATHARDLGRELWVVPGPPGDAYQGSWHVLDTYKGAKMLRHEQQIVERLRQLETSPPMDLDDDAKTVLNALGSRAKHPDELAAETGLSTPAVTTALLTLALGDVVVEGSAGLYQRK